MKDLSEAEDGLVWSIHLTELARQAGTGAAREALQAGIPVVFARDGRIVRQYPDGREEIIKTINDMIDPTRVNHLEVIENTVKSMRERGDSDQEIINWLIQRYTSAMDSLRAQAEMKEFFSKKMSDGSNY